MGNSFNDFWKENSNLSNIGGKISIGIGVILFILGMIILGLGIEKYNIKLSGDNLVYILGGFFVSALILIIFPLYFGTKIKKIDSDNIREIRKEEKEEEEKKIKELVDDSKEDLISIKNTLVKEKSSLKLFDFNNFKLDNIDYYRYLIKHKGLTKEINRYDRFIVQYEIEDKIFSLIKRNVERDFNTTDSFKKHFEKYDDTKWPKFKFENEETIENKIIEIIKILNKLEKIK